MNWGKGIAIFMACFIAFISVLVYKTSQQDIALEYDDYYQRELAFNETQQQLQNTISENKNMKINITNDSLWVYFPNSTFSNGTIWLYRASDSKLDKQYKNVKQLFVIPLHVLKSGLYEVRSEWTQNNITYQDKQSVFIP